MLQLTTVRTGYIYTDVALFNVRTWRRQGQSRPIQTRVKVKSRPHEVDKVNNPNTPSKATSDVLTLAHTGKNFKEFAENAGRKNAIRWIKGKGYRIVPDRKKDGSIRNCYSPEKGLKEIQKELDTMLRAFDNLQESHGFTLGKSNLTAAESHRKRWIACGNYTVIGSDLKEAFPSIKEQKVRAMLQDKMPQLTGWQAHCWTKLLCRRNNPGKAGELTTGSPASPTILNIILQKIDIQLSKLARRYGGHYTRYADDLCISIGTHDPKKAQMVRKRMREILKAEGHTPHPKKHYTIRLGKDAKHGEIVGVKASAEETRAPQKLKRKLRAWKHNLIQARKAGDDWNCNKWVERVAGLERYNIYLKRNQLKC